MRASLFSQRQSIDYYYPNSYYVNPYTDRYLNENYYPDIYHNANNYPHNNYYNNHLPVPSQTWNNTLTGSYPAMYPSPPVTFYPQRYFPGAPYGNPLGHSKGILIPSKGVEQILIAILILVALDLIFIRWR